MFFLLVGNQQRGNKYKQRGFPWVSKGWNSQKQADWVQ